MCGWVLEEVESTVVFREERSLRRQGGRRRWTSTQYRKNFVANMTLDVRLEDARSGERNLGTTDAAETWGLRG
jgi:hypothetical protein